MNNMTQEDTYGRCEKVFQKAIDALNGALDNKCVRDTIDKLVGLDVVIAKHDYDPEYYTDTELIMSVVSD